ncbi:MAG: PEP-utilizing enzyme [Promethearchaeota archaeon]
MEKVGIGLSCSLKSEVSGELVYIQTIEDVIKLFDNASGKICIVEDAGITTLSPILSDLVGTVCTKGSAGSHLAIVSREFNLPCIMGTKFTIKDISSLTGKIGKIMHDGDDKGILYLLD